MSTPHPQDAAALTPNGPQLEFDLDAMVLEIRGDAAAVARISEAELDAACAAAGVRRTCQVGPARFLVEWIALRGRVDVRGKAYVEFPRDVARRRPELRWILEGERGGRYVRGNTPRGPVVIVPAEDWNAWICARDARGGTAGAGRAARVHPPTRTP